MFDDDKSQIKDSIGNKVVVFTCVGKDWMLTTTVSNSESINRLIFQKEACLINFVQNLLFD